MNITRIRCRLLTLVTGSEADEAGGTSPSSPSPAESTGPSTAPVPAAAGLGGSEAFADGGRSPWAAGMACPSFMIVSTLPRR